MKKISTGAILLTFIALSIRLECAQAQMTMDAAWTVISDNGTNLVLELGIRTNTPSENLGPAIFTFTYDNLTYISYSSASWQTGFDPLVSAYSGPATGVTESLAGTINIELDFPGGTGTAISS